MARPLYPKPATMTLLFSSLKFKELSFGTNAVILLIFLISLTFTHFQIAELGCLISTHTFSKTISLAWQDPWRGLAFHLVPKLTFM